jgi:hypothetical protein
MTWVGLILFLMHLGSRRRLDNLLDRNYPQVLANINRLAQTRLNSLPVHDTLDYFLGRVPVNAFAELRQLMVQRLIRMKALDDARLLGHAQVIIDATGLFSFQERHCPACLERKTSSGACYQHQALEAKLLGPAGIVISMATEFIENADAAHAGRDPEQFKQDCELKAFQRLAPRLKRDFPQLLIVLGGDGLYACGATFQVARDNRWSYVLTFKSGRLPTVWDEFERLKQLAPENVRRRQLPDGVSRVFRWVNDLSYEDDQKRRWTFHALECVETSPAGEEQRFAWITDLPVGAKNVETIAQGGRARWKIENEAFNRQKNHGPNLEHMYCEDPERWKAYYYLLQIAFILTQLVERGSLLRQLAAAQHSTWQRLFGSLSNIVGRMREAFRLLWWPDECFDEAAAKRRRISLDTS